MRVNGQKLALLLLIPILMIVALGSVDYANRERQGQSSRPQGIEAGLSRTHPALEGEVAGKVLPYESKASDPKRAVLSHPPPKIWLVFSESKITNQPLNKSAEVKRTTRVDLPFEANEILLSFWKESLDFYFKMDYEGVQDADTYMTVTLAHSKSALMATRELQRLTLLAPDGARKISESEARDLIRFIGDTSLAVVRQAKRVQELAHLP